MTLGVEFASSAWAEDCQPYEGSPCKAAIDAPILQSVASYTIPNAARLQMILTRIFDVVSAAAVLFAALPALILLAVALQIDSPGRLFFVQQRVGRGGKMFPT